ncbi:catalase family peroxidase [Rhodoblastus sp.]|jgi:catalase|uniref:catalase family peroxidase n=1 Tax=Rhodoblastus sp. TaxID=1962975 RepID=UPI0025F22718|nr:catalase family peroxidase [Rhodoblastus sp.]
MKVSELRKHAAISAVAVFVGAGVAAAQEKAAPTSSTPEQMVEAINGVFGKHPGFRAVHAKGVVLEGVFTPNPAAASVSKAVHLQKTPVPVTIRFSDFAGVPTIPDTDGMARPHGLAIKFHLPGGGETDIVAHSFNGFPVATTDEFRALLLALAASGPDAPKPTPLDAFLGTHPIAKTFLTTPKPLPVSYATLPYYGVNSFKFTNAKGDVAYVRYQFLPAGGTQIMPADQAAKADADYLGKEIRDRVTHEPVKLEMVAQIAKSGDKIEDPSIAWPDSRRTVDLGTIEITKAAADSAAAEKSLLFLPGAVTAGIDAADPMIDARSAAYPLDFSRRNP